MSENTQYIIIGLVVGWSGLFLARRLYNTFKTPKDGCGNACGCAVTDLKKQKK
jgi:hypothetical protein